MCFLTYGSIAAATALASPTKAGQHTSINFIIKISFQDSVYQIKYNFVITIWTTFEYIGIEWGGSKRIRFGFQRNRFLTIYCQSQCPTSLTIYRKR